MSWSKPSENLLGMLERFARHVPFQKKKMFGQYALFLNGHMFAGVFQHEVFIRYPPEKQKELMKTNYDIEQFQPIKGRSMREYITIPETIYSDKQEMTKILEESISYVRSFPPKQD